MASILDVSDLYTTAQGVVMLPTRSNKQVLTLPVTQADLASGENIADHNVTARIPQNFDYVSIRIPGRGGSQAGIPDASSYADFSFLIAPSEVQVARQTVDEQSFSRAGWQVGVWGEDIITISISGKTPGKYYSYGTTDADTELSMSYRNLLALELFFENNGYWFEGEQVQSALAATTTPRQIKMHTDVRLTVGEFIWSGMFETMEVTEDADTPFLADFSLTFLAWKEAYRKNTPYPDSIGGAILRGHVPLLTASSQASATQTSVNANTQITQNLVDPTSTATTFGDLA